MKTYGSHQAAAECPTVPVTVSIQIVLNNSQQNILGIHWYTYIFLVAEKVLLIENPQQFGKQDNIGGGVCLYLIVFLVI